MNICECINKVYKDKTFKYVYYLTLKLPEGGGQMALPLGILAMVHIWRKNVVFGMYVNLVYKFLDAQ